jgi:hypothetical protein
MASVQYPDKQNTILGVVSSIENFPTADVVPKSEVEAEFEKRLAKYQDEEKCIYTYDGEIWDFCVQGPCPHNKVLEEVRQEVAREIFEELARKSTYVFPTMLYTIAKRDVDELKNKYTEEKE